MTSYLAGSSISNDENQIEYTVFNKVSKLTNLYSPIKYEYTYGPDDQRRKRRFYISGHGDISTTIFVNGGLYEERSNGDRLHYISTPAGLGALVVTNKNDPAKKDIYYLYNDHLGSLIATTKQGSGVIEELSGVYPDTRREPLGPKTKAQQLE